MREDLPPIRRAALLAETPHYPAPQLQQQAIPRGCNMMIRWYGGLH